MFSWYKYLIVNLVFFSHLGFWSGNLFMIAPFPDLCLLVLFSLILAMHFPWGINGNLQTYPRTYRSVSVYENELYTMCALYEGLDGV